MKIKLSKSQWEKMGKTAGWIKKQAAITQQFPAKINLYGNGNAIPMGQHAFALEIEITIGGATYQIPIGQHIPEAQELYQVIAEDMKQTQPSATPSTPSTVL